VLKTAVAGALSLLGLPMGSSLDNSARNCSAAVSGGLPPPAAKSADNTSKLMEEIKLYWTVQVAVGGILGYLGANLSFASATAEKNIFLCGVSFLLIAMGAIYNLIGNYYARVEGVQAGRSDYQENLFTPTLALIYLIVSAMLGGIFTHSTLTASGVESSLAYDTLLGSVLGFLLNWIICRHIFRELYDYAPQSYVNYSQHIRRLYLYYDKNISLPWQRS
jgi:hypothetical protein